MTQKEAILAVLKSASGPLTRAAILDQMQGLGGRRWRGNSVSSTLTGLHRRGLIGHPEGSSMWSRDGWQLTSAGRTLDAPTLVQTPREDQGEDEYDEDYLETGGEEEEEDAEANETTTATREEGLPNGYIRRAEHARSKPRGKAIFLTPSLSLSLTDVRLQTMEQRLSAMEQRVQDTREAVEAQLARHQGILVRMEKQFVTAGEADQRWARLGDIIEQARNSIKQLEEMHRQEAHERISELERQQKALSLSWGEVRFAGVDERLQSLEARLQEHRQKHVDQDPWGDMAERLDALEQRRVSHDDTHTVLDRRIGRIESDAPPHDCRLVTHSQLLSRLDSQRGRTDSVETAMVTLRDRIGALEERLSATEWSPRRRVAERLDALAEWVRGDE